MGFQFIQPRGHDKDVVLSLRNMFYKKRPLGAITLEEIMFKYFSVPSVRNMLQFPSGDSIAKSFNQAAFFLD